MMIQLLRRKGTTDITFKVVGTDGKTQHEAPAELLLQQHPNHGPEYSHLFTLYVDEAEARKAGMPALAARVMT